MSKLKYVQTEPDYFKGIKICVLQPDYSTSDVDYQHYDPARNLSHLTIQIVNMSRNK